MLIYLATAFAGPFQTSDLQYSMDLTYTWNDVAVTTGTTNFDFISGTEVSTGAVCQHRSTHCLNGDFITGNSAEGTYRSRMRVSGCTVVGGGFFPPHLSWQCNTRQTLRLQYGGTSAVYNGSATLGIVTFDTNLAGAAFNVVFTDNNVGTYSGTMSSDTVGGTFIE